MNWSQLPDPTPRVSRITWVLPWLLAWVPFSVHHGHDDVRSWVVDLALIALAEVLAVRLAPAAAPIAGIVAVNLVVWRVGPEQGATAAIIVAGGALAWTIAVGVARGPRWSLPQRTGRPLALPLGLAALLLVATSGTAAPLLLTGIAYAWWLTAAVLPGPTGRLVDSIDRRVGGIGRFATRTADRMGRPLGRAVGAVAMVPLGAFLTVSWAIQRALGVDPLAPPTEPGSRWVRRDGADVHPDRLASSVLVPTHRSAGDIARRVAASALIVAVWVVPGAYVIHRLDLRSQARAEATKPTAFAASASTSTWEGDGCPVSCTVFADTPHWKDVFAETSAFTAHATFDASTVFRFLDQTGRYVNETDGRRATWSPPACSCRRIVVWWYGGSAAWGFWQRDQHTLPSELARAAWKQGIALDIENRAMPGWVAGQGVRRFAQDLAATPDDQLPDLVVFYDGANDVAQQVDRNRSGLGSDESEPSILETDLDRLIRSGLLPNARPDQIPGDPEQPRIGTGNLARHIVNRYERNVDLGTRLAGSIGAEPVFAWQPTATSSPKAARGPLATPVDAHSWQRIIEAARPRLPDGVVDLSDSLAQVTTPIWGDLVHTNETGARLVADSLLQEILPQLQELRAHR